MTRASIEKKALRRRGWIAGSSPAMTATASIRGDAARLDRATPARDLAGDELGEVVRASAFRRRDLLAERFEALAYRRAVERLAHGLIEAAHERLGRALGQEQALPGADFEIEALLARSRDVRQDRGPPRARAGDRLDRVAFDLRQRSRHRIAHVVDAAGHEVRHRGPQAAIGNM